MSFCHACGAALPASAAFCPSCGARPAHTNDAAPSFDRAPTADVFGAGAAPSTEVLKQKIFIGRNYDLYAAKWALANAKKSPTSWNWAAFFLGVGWMAYRKMYKFSFIFIAVLALETIVEYLLKLPVGISVAVNMGVAVTFGLLGNSWYLLHVRQKVDEISRTLPPQLVESERRRQGGTHVGWALLMMLAWVVVISAVVLVFDDSLQEDEMQPVSSTEVRQPAPTLPVAAMAPVGISGQASRGV